VLRHADVTPDTDRRLSEAVARWTGAPVKLVPYSRDPAACDALLNLLERFGRRGQMAEARVNDREAFLYICAKPDGQTFTQGLGDTPVLAICDAFLAAKGEESRPAPAPPPAPVQAPAEPLFQAAGYRPPAPEPKLWQCVNCGWEGPTPEPDPRRCPGCHRNFLRPLPRRTR
jgi:hypothetical protein